MEELAKNLPINELIEELDHYMVSLGYAPSTLRHFRQAWGALKNLALKRGTTYFTKELGFELLRDHYHIEPYASKLSEYKAVIRRSVMLLLEFQISGTIIKRTPRSDYEFSKNYAKIGNAHINFLITDLHLRDGTLRNHRHILFKLFQFLEMHQIANINEVNSNVIATFLKLFIGLSKNYISSVIRILQSFFDFSFSVGAISQKLTLPKIVVYKDQKIPEYYSAEEIQKILAAIDRANPLGKRNYAMILLAVRYGLRISDIISLKFSNIDFQCNRIRIIQKKTNKPLELDLLPDVGWAIIDYVKNGRPETTDSTIFLRHTHPYVPFANGVNMEYIIRQYAVSSGVSKVGATKKASFHTLRYSLASDLLQKNISLTTISGILGHSEINVTTRYTQLNTAQLKDCALEVTYD